MDEARRMLRYIFPGLLFIIELLILLLLLDSRLLFNEQNGILHKINTETNLELFIGLPITALVASGGLGYLFSILHHFLYWHLYTLLARLPKSFLICDHRKMLENAREKDYLILCSQKGERIDKKCGLSAANAWRLVAAFWHERIKTSETVEGAEPRAQTLTDMMHGAGAALVACAGAIVTCYFVLKYNSDKSLLDYPYFIAAIALFLIHLLNYIKVVKHTQSVINTICADELALLGHTILIVSNKDFKTTSCRKN